MTEGQEPLFQFESGVEDDAASENSGSPPISRYAVTSHGADFVAEVLVRKLRSGEILRPDFQRAYVWKLPQASRFIESLILGLPVPGLFFSMDQESKRLVVIDGQQRLGTLQRFYDGQFSKNEPFVLEDVQADLVGKTYKTLEDNDRVRLDEAVIRATIIRQDEPNDDNSSMYYIFERLNTGGSPLNPQEIRGAVYYGPFVQLLRELNKDKAWRNLYGPTSLRLKDQELILRFLAFIMDEEAYERPMKEFLNKFMRRYRYLDQEAEEKFRSIFSRTMQAIEQMLGRRAFRPGNQLNTAVFDAIAIGLARRIERGQIEDVMGANRALSSLFDDESFQEAYKKSTSNEASVHLRINLAAKAFGALQ